MRRHDEYADAAKKAADAGKWALAEEMYLRAAQAIATSKLSADVKDRKLYDAAAKRCHRLATIQSGKP